MKEAIKGIGLGVFACLRGTQTGYLVQPRPLCPGHFTKNKSLIRWLSEPTVLTPDGLLLSCRYTSTLTLLRLKPFEAGHYSFQARNARGEETLTFELTLLCE